MTHPRPPPSLLPSPRGEREKKAEPAPAFLLIVSTTPSQHQRGPLARKAAARNPRSSEQGQNRLCCPCNDGRRNCVRSSPPRSVPYPSLAQVFWKRWRISSDQMPLPFM